MERPEHNGNQLPDGTYTLHVTAKAADGSAVQSVVSSNGIVTEVDMTGGTPVLMIGPMPISLTDVAGVRAFEVNPAPRKRRLEPTVRRTKSQKPEGKLK